MEIPEEFGGLHNSLEFSHALEIAYVMMMISYHLLKPITPQLLIMIDELKEADDGVKGPVL